MLKTTEKMLDIKNHNSHAWKKIAGVLLLAVLAIGVVIYWVHSQRYADTDDAYVNANVVQIAPRVSGQVIVLNVKNNQFVKRGDLLFAIDCAPFEISRAKAAAQFNMAAADYKYSRSKMNRVVTLFKDKVSSAQDKEDASAKFDDSFAALQLSKAALQQAELDLQYTKIYAAADGYVTEMSLRNGDMVTANQPVFALVSDEQYWVDANFKETELHHIRVGQPADITVDMYPGHNFKGIVDSISNGSGAAFSLLPPQNATGNWVKVTQRVPVKIRIINPDAKYPLRVGTTADVTIDTHR